VLGYFILPFSVSPFISVVYLVGVAHFGWFGLLVLVFLCGVLVSERGEENHHIVSNIYFLGGVAKTLPP